MATAFLLLKDWRTWVIIGSLALVVTFTYAVHEYGEARYREGYKASEHKWEEQLSLAHAERDRANAQLAEVRRQRDTEINRRVEAIRAQLAHTQEAIHNAPDTESRYAAYLVLDSSLRAHTTERFATVGADYNASLGPNTDGRAGTVEP